MSATFGEQVREARLAARLTLRAVGERLGVSAPYLHDVEHDRRRLAVHRWPALIAALPSLTLASLAAAFVTTGRVDVDAAMLTGEQRASLAAALEAQARAA